MAHSLEKRIVRIQAERRRRRRAARRSMRLRLPEPAARRVARCSRSTASPSPTATLDVFEDVDFDVGRGERLLVMGLNGAGKTSLLRILAGETDSRRRRRPLRARACRPATTRRSTRASQPGVTLLDHLREQAAGARRPGAAGGCSACSA